MLFWGYLIYYDASQSMVVSREVGGERTKRVKRGKYMVTEGDQTVG